jgi:hypothetical protein
MVATEVAMSGGEDTSAAAELDLFYAGTAARILRQLVLLTGDALSTLLDKALGPDWATS